MGVGHGRRKVVCRIGDSGIMIYGACGRMRLARMPALEYFSRGDFGAFREKASPVECKSRKSDTIVGKRL
jgi:hypothetical protein